MLGQERRQHLRTPLKDVPSIRVQPGKQKPRLVPQTEGIHSWALVIWVQKAKGDHEDFSTMLIYLRGHQL